MLRSFGYALPVVALAAFCLYMAMHHLGMARDDLSAASDFRDHFLLYSSMSSVRTAIAGAFVVMGLLCTALLGVARKLSGDIRTCQERIATLERELRRRDADAMARQLFTGPE